MRGGKPVVARRQSFGCRFVFAFVGLHHPILVSSPSRRNEAPSLRPLPVVRQSNGHNKKNLARDLPPSPIDFRPELFLLCGREGGKGFVGQLAIDLLGLIEILRIDLS